ncbi:MAG: transposase [Deltaproteobacteria bacterium]|nr:transposase [Deltaproteobacteria bacterium]
MRHRVVEIRWLPRSDADWATFTTARRAAADLWNTMVVLHTRLRRLGWAWPTLARWTTWAKGRAPGLSAQSVQQVVRDFCDTLSATTKARNAQQAAGEEPTTRYPWKVSRYRDVPYSNQTAVVRHGMLRLPHGRGGGTLAIPLPVDRSLPGRLMEVSLAYGVVRLVCEVPDAVPQLEAPVIGVDLGVNTLLAATDGRAAVLVSGRAAKAIVRYRNKAGAALSSRIDRKMRGSKRRKKLVRAKHRMLDRSARKLKDTLHKATRAVADAFAGHRVIVGEPFNDAARKVGRSTAQQVSSASNSRLVAMLNYKLSGAVKVPEPYSSQTCPGCGCRQKCRRVYRCATCGWSAPRDAVGAVNIRSIGLYGAMRPQQPVLQRIVFVRPLRKYPATLQGAAGSPGGTPAREAACAAPV